ncbi:MAG TPA: pyridoxamine 5'-phosphate oxidase [Gammaproteobacteria bacterium]|jgi:hypothetical protein|nr:pyridoxamine 5'-phosphate oxidase [Gammaproteobacteria bacterium]
MAKQFSEITPRLRTFIEHQKLFFVATAAAEGHVNLSPKGMETFRVLGENRVAWLNLTGSGNESAAHVLEDPRMTIMFCAFDGDPMILRLYGEATAVHKNDPQWTEIAAVFPSLPGARQCFDVRVTLVQASCGFGVPLMDYVGDRDQLISWATRQGESGVRRYWEKKNTVSLDGKPTHILQKNT